MGLYTAQDISFMQKAIALARGGQYTARPNPCVGAVLVKDGKIVGEGFHHHFGGDHAEVMALKQAGDAANGASCYVTLEPCSHFGKTSPCVDALIEAGIKKVVIASLDPNPQVNGQGIKKLEENGIAVTKGLLELQAQRLNPAFYHRMEKQQPYIVVKSAMSFDARTAVESGESKWITGSKSRSQVQQLRANADAIITGIETVLADDPEMTVRKEDIVNSKEFKQPKRIILDSRLRMPLNAKILQQADETIIATTSSDTNKIKQLEDRGVTVWQMQGEQINLDKLMQYLLKIECHYLLVEAGGTLSGAFWEKGLVNEWHVFVAPKLLGSKGRPVLDMEVPMLSSAPGLELIAKDMADDDFHLVFRPKTQQELA